MDRYRSMLAFIQVAEHGGFSLAARSLEISTSAVSRQVMELEDFLDIQLLNRTTRHVSLTDAGTDYLEQCKELVEGIDNLQTTAKDQLANPHGRIRITAPVFMGKHILGPMLPNFLHSYPHVHVELQLLDRHINLIDEGFDLALRIGVLRDSTLIARKLGDFKISLVASPDYLQRVGTPKSVNDLKQHNCLIDTAPTHGNRWPLGKKSKSAIRVEGNITVNSGELARELALAGTGIALLPDFFVMQDIASKKLIKLLEHDIHELNSGVYLVYPQTRHLSRAVRVFIDHLLEEGPTLLKGLVVPL